MKIGKFKAVAGAAAFCGFMALTNSTSFGEDVGPAIYQAEAPGVLLIRTVGVKTDDSMVSDVGTGFVIDNDAHVLTAGHVIPDGADFKSVVVGGSFGPSTAGAPSYQLRVIGRSGDVALLQMVHPPASMTILPIRKTRAVIGEQLFVLGYPLGLPDTHFLDGVVGAVADDTITTNSLVDRGNSGGPVVDSRGCVIGIVHGELASRDGETVNGIKFATPIMSVLGLLPAASAVQRNASSVSASDVIHVSDTLSRTQTDHGMTETIRAYNDRIDARSGYVIEAVEGVGHNSMNPMELSYPTPLISNDGRYMTFAYSLSSGPFYDRRRGWIDMTISTRQRRIGAGPQSSVGGSCN